MPKKQLTTVLNRDKINIVRKCELKLPRILRNIFQVVGSQLLTNKTYRRKNMKTKLLSEFSIGEKGVVKTVSGEGRLRRRLFDMGVTPGAEVLLRKKAPLGDPIEIHLRGYELTLRLSEAELVTLEVIR